MPLSTQLDITDPFHTGHESPRLPPLVRLNIRGSSSPSSTSILSASHSSTSASLPSPRLVTYEPESLSAGAISLVFIENIQRVEINETRVRGGETFFVLDVFMYHFDTHLPTNLAYLRRAAHSATSSSSATASVEESVKPDYQVERRFIDFCDLRHQVYDAASLNPHIRCASCDEFICYVRFKLWQPRPVAHLLTTGRRAARRAILAAFVNDFLHMVFCRDKQNHKCESHGLMLVALEAFLRDTVSSSLSSSRLSA